MKKITLLLSVILLALGFQAKAQTQNPIWCMPPYYVRFNPGPQSPVQYLPTNTGTNDYNGDPAQYCSNAMPDGSGNILFFVIDNKIYDGQGRLIDYLIGASPIDYTNGPFTFSAHGNTEMCIVPDPLNCNKFYLYFQQAALPSLGGSYINAYYATLDMSQPGIYDAPYGKLQHYHSTYHKTPGNVLTPVTYTVLKVTNFPVPKNGSICFAATPVRSDNSRFLYTADQQGGIHRYVFGNTAPYTTNYSFSLGANLSTFLRPELEIKRMSDGTYRLATAVLANSLNFNVTFERLYMATLNTNGELIPGSIHYIDLNSSPTQQLAYIHGIEFSESGDYIYVSHAITSNYSVPLGWCAFNGTTINPINVSNPTDFQYSQIELGQDGKMYFAYKHGLAVYNTPNTPPSNTLNPTGWVANPLTFTVPPALSFFLPSGTQYPQTPFDFSPPLNDPEISSYMLPDQMDGEDYSTITGIGFNNIVYVATVGAPQVWQPGVSNNPWNSVSGDVYIKKELEIPAGAYITIKNMTFHFAPGAKVVVDRGTGTYIGGKLILDHSIFTIAGGSACENGSGQMWAGIRALGNPAQSQVPIGNSQQAYVNIKNNSVVEDADTALFAGLVTDDAHGGAIIRGNNSAFHNNRVDVAMDPYNNISPQYNNGSKFTLCHFYTDAALNNPTIYPSYHAYLRNVDGVGFYGNTFENTASVIYPDPFFKGSGIYEVNCRTFVESKCNNPFCSFPTPISMTTPNTFRNLFYGIEHFSYNTGKALICEQNDFYNNYFGIYMAGANISKINQNNFSIHVDKPVPPYFNPPLNTYGLKMVACNHYSVQENNFYGYSNAPSGNTYGAIVINSGTNYNEIYRNQFHTLYVGGQSQGTNASDVGTFPSNNIGLRWLCNDFTDSVYFSDLTVTNGPKTNGRIDYHQGTVNSSTAQAALTEAANNHFSYFGQYDFYVNPNVLNLPQAYKDMSIHYVGNYTSHYYLRDMPLSYSANYITSLKAHTGVNTPVTMNASACPSKLVPVVIVVVLSQINGLTGRINHNRGLIDGGNKDSLIAVIQSGMSPGQIKNVMMQYSPYLTSDVLLAYLGINPPNGHIKQVIEANSPVADTVIAALNNMNLPHGIQNQINNAQSGTSALQALRDSTSYLIGQRSYDIDKILRYYVSDTSSTSHAQDSIIATLKRFSFIGNYKRLLAQAYLNVRNTTKASQVNDSIKAKIGVCNDTRLTDVQIALCSATCAQHALLSDSSLMAATVAVANDSSDGITCMRARVLLSLAVDSLHFAPIVPIILTNNQRRANTTDSTPHWSAATQITLFPNPARNQFNLVLRNSDTKQGSGVMKMYNLLGALQMQTKLGYGKNVINTKNLPSGIYLVHIKLDNGQQWQQKLVIER